MTFTLNIPVYLAWVDLFIEIKIWIYVYENVYTINLLFNHLSKTRTHTKVLISKDMLMYSTKITSLGLPTCYLKQSLNKFLSVIVRTK